MFRRGNPCFFAFDLLTCDGKDLRTERLLDRKQELRRLLAKVSPPFPATDQFQKRKEEFQAEHPPFGSPLPSGSCRGLMQLSPRHDKWALEDAGCQA
jgi:hypothetical protein